MRSPDVVARRVGDETILVPVRAGIVEGRCLFTLNETASVVWRHLARPSGVDRLAAALAREFAVSATRARADALRLVRRLRVERCVREVDRGSKPSR